MKYSIWLLGFTVWPRFTPNRGICSAIACSQGEDTASWILSVVQVGNLSINSESHIRNRSQTSCFHFGSRQPVAEVWSNMNVGGALTSFIAWEG